MPKLPIVSGKFVMQFLEREGFVHTRSKGSHRVYVKQFLGEKYITVVPEHKELDIGTLKAVLKQSHVSEEYFITHME